MYHYLVIFIHLLFTCSVSLVELLEATSLVNSSSQFIPGETFTFFEGKEKERKKMKIKHDCQYWHVAFNFTNKHTIQWVPN